MKLSFIKSLTWVFRINVMLVSIFCVGCICGVASERKITVKRAPVPVKSKQTKSMSSFSDNNNEKRDSLLIVKSGSTVKIDADGKMTVFSLDSLSFAGYDKQLNSAKESMFVINRSNVQIRKINFKIVYLDIDGRMLHSRNVTTYCDIPPRETRKVDFQSWDTQNSFYYHLSGKPRRKAAPYKIEFTPLSCSILIPTKNDM